MPGCRRVPGWRVITMTNEPAWCLVYGFLFAREPVPVLGDELRAALDVITLVDKTPEEAFIDGFLLGLYPNAAQEEAVILAWLAFTNGYWNSPQKTQRRCLGCGKPSGTLIWGRCGPCMREGLLFGSPQREYEHQPILRNNLLDLARLAWWQEYPRPNYEEVS